jgi:SOS-response transcriptional repressor LexA
MALSKEKKVVGIAIMEDNSVKVSTKVIVKDGDDVAAMENGYYVIRKLDADGNATDVSAENADVKSVCAIAFA